MSARVTEAMVEAGRKWFEENFNGLPNTDALVRGVLAAALSTEPGEAEAWRDISTAPKDGTFIMTRAGRWLRPAVVHWATYGGVTKWGGDPEGFMEEDHFMQYWTEVRYEPIEWLPLEALDALPAAPLPKGTHHDL